MQDIFEINKFKSNKPVLNTAKKYKTYMTIRRDLRNAHLIVKRNIALKESINNREFELSKISSDSMLVERDALMHSLTLYSRWFKSTVGKPTLKPRDFFTKNGFQEKQHKVIIELRDKYLAHNEHDLLGQDRVLVIFGRNGKAINIGSDFIENQFISHKELDLQGFLNCIEVVHNKIDAEIIPELKQKLLKIINLSSE